jgi:hypothetical protein
MSATHNKIALPLAAVGVVLLGLLFAGVASAAAPIKLSLSSRFGWEVNVDKANFCSVAAKETCQPASPNNHPGGFEYPRSVAVDPQGNIYAAETGDNRVQELSSAGTFVLMFGQEVNQTKDRDSKATEAERDVCTEVEIKTAGVECGPGEGGEVAGAMKSPTSIAIDPSTEDLYVQDFSNNRVDEYTKSGEFILTIGKNVNEAKDKILGASEAEKNLCKAGEVCTSGVRSSPESSEESAFDFALSGNTLSVGKEPADLLYVGDDQRIQEFDPAGEWKGEIKLPSSVTSSAPEAGIRALAADTKSATVYAVYGEQPVVRQFDATTKEEVKNFEVPVRNQGGAEVIEALALDSAGDLAVAEGEENHQFGSTQFGQLYEPLEARALTSFSIPGERSTNGVEGIVFNGKNELYAAVLSAQEVLAYRPVEVGEVRTGAAACSASGETNTDQTFECTLDGQINPYKLADTEAWFEWGPTCKLGTMTAKQAFPSEEALLPLSATLTGVRPNQTVCYQIVGADQNAQPPEALDGSRLTVATETVAPETLGAPAAQFVKAQSAVLSASLNPENADTGYRFEYGACPTLAGCQSVHSTPIEKSEAYGEVAASRELTGLAPQTTYSYRLVASNEFEEAGKTLGGKATSVEGTFTTGALSTVQAATGSPSAITPTSAVISGAVNPDGETAVYTFELGVYQGASTQYGIVLSASVLAETSAVSESEQLTGLQPGTTYAYRIDIAGGYGTATGETVLFTTAGLPAVLTTPQPLALLTPPNIAFPKETGTAPTTTKALTKAQKLARALKVCKGDKQKSKRVACEKAADKKYGSKQKKSKAKQK